jgi:molybdopterin-containing oxidoreductase family iron-sulfur binding subunit
MSRLYVVESTPSVTGSNADHRLPIRSCDIENFTRAVANQLGVISETSGNPLLENHGKWIAALVQDLKANLGRGIVIAGESQPPLVHALAHRINQVLGNAGTTVTYTASAEAEPVNQVASLRELAADSQKGLVEALLIIGGNPVFSAPADFNFSGCLARVGFRVHLSSEMNETSAACNWHIPENHYLESWSDARAYDGTISIVQPLILPLYQGKSAMELLDAVIQQPARSDYEIVRSFWQTQNHWPDFENGWRQALHDGWIANSTLPAKEVRLNELRLPPRRSSAEQVEIHFRPDPTIWDGRFANNGWLQELPKPVTKLTWDNAALISPAMAQRHKVSNGDLLELDFHRRKLSVPAWITPGQADNSLALHLGYGRSRVGRVGAHTGFNAYLLRQSDALWFGTGVLIKKTGDHYPLAATQMHHAIDSEERQVYRETTLSEFFTTPELVRRHNVAPSASETLFNPAEHEYDGYHWGMSIDLTACIGCNACILACQSENNIPIVGKIEVERHREMHWLRVDTYFSGTPDNPAMNHQPVPCMHCENAPCELVCPVGATLHDHEGLNLQVYNRCIGTRYCSNNCPYKVRRFNFFQYADAKTPGYVPMRNPNVTVRSRGVMEKCTYCIQRISDARIQSKIENRRIHDGEIRTACQQACPAEAIVFGDISNPDSRVAVLKKLSLDFAMLGELNTRPRTTYLAKVRNPNPALAETATLMGGPTHG